MTTWFDEIISEEDQHLCAVASTVTAWAVHEFTRYIEWLFIDLAKISA